MNCNHLLNNLPSKNAIEVIEKRIDIFGEQLSLEKERVVAWGFCHAVLATCWSIEDNGDFDQSFFRTIDVFKELSRSNET